MEEGGRDLPLLSFALPPPPAAKPGEYLWRMCLRVNDSDGGGSLQKKTAGVSRSKVYTFLVRRVSETAEKEDWMA